MPQIREVIDRSIEVMGSVGFLYLRETDNGVHLSAEIKVGTSAAGLPITELKGIGEFSRADLLAALEKV